ncbi:hypothetical protein D3C80_1232750 [compost metagenome]
MGLDDGVVTIDLRHGLDRPALDVLAAETGHEVPVDLYATLGDRECVVTRIGEIAQASAFVDQLHIDRTFLRRGVDSHRYRSGTVTWIDRNLVSVRVALEHGELAGGQLVLVLLGIGRRDGEQRLLVLEGVTKETLAVHRCRAGLEAAVPGGNAFVGVAFLLRTQWSQGRTELGRFLFADGGHDAAGQQGKRQACAGNDFACFHGCTLCLLRLRS